MKRPAQGPINRLLTHIHTVPLINWLTIASAAARGAAGVVLVVQTQHSVFVPWLSRSLAGGRTELRNTMKRLQSPQAHRERQISHKVNSCLQVIPTFAIKSKFGKLSEFVKTCTGLEEGAQSGLLPTFC